jgi:hypothetical protein
LAVFACSEDAAPPSIPPLPVLALIAPGGAGDAPCVARGDDPRKTITGQVSVRNFTLRPPLACTVAECGTVRLSLSRSGGGAPWTFDSADRWIPIPTLDLPDGRYDVTASLLDTFGVPYCSSKGDDGKPPCKDDGGSFTLAPSCGEEEPEPEPESEPTDDGGAPALDASTNDAGNAPSVSDAGNTPSSPDASPLDAGAFSDAAVEFADAAVESPDAALTGVDAATAPVLDASTPSNDAAPDAALVP